DYQAPRPEPVALASPEQALFTHERVQRDWWKQLQDPQLDRLVALALARNQDIRLAQARLAEARAVLDERELDRWPAVTAQGDYARSLSQLNAGPAGQRNLARSYQAGFDAVWEIDLFGRLRRAAESAAAASQASEADLAQIRVVVAAEVARNYFEMRGAEQRLRVARDSLASQRDTLRIVQALADSGRGNESDVASARAELATVEASLPVQETARRLAAYRLAVLAGLRPAELGELEPAPSLAPLATRLPIGAPGRRRGGRGAGGAPPPAPGAGPGGAGGGGTAPRAPPAPPARAPASAGRPGPGPRRARARAPHRRVSKAARRNTSR
ncbi:TolC family protein, partial [Bordetella hinzii]|nr:TolC family protein [Bordetella hinzii]